MSIFCRLYQKNAKNSGYANILVINKPFYCSFHISLIHSFSLKPKVVCSLDVNPHNYSVLLLSYLTISLVAL